MKAIFYQIVWIDIEHISGPFWSDQQILLELYATTHSNRHLSNFYLLLGKMMQVSALIRVFKFMLLEGIGVFTLTLKMKMWEKQQRLLWKCSHKEEHSRMLFNAWFKSRPNTLVINTADTDFLVITLWNTPKVFQGLKAWLEIGLTSDKYTVVYGTMLQ